MCSPAEPQAVPWKIFSLHFLNPWARVPKSELLSAEHTWKGWARRTLSAVFERGWRWTRFRCLGQNKSPLKAEQPRPVYPGSKAVADLASEIHSLFPAEIPKHLPVSQLLPDATIAAEWQRRTDKYLCKAHRARSLEHCLCGGRGRGQGGSCL